MVAAGTEQRGRRSKQRGDCLRRPPQRKIEIATADLQLEGVKAATKQASGEAGQAKDIALRCLNHEDGGERDTRWTKWPS